MDELNLHSIQKATDMPNTDPSEETYIWQSIPPNLSTINALEQSNNIDIKPLQEVRERIEPIPLPITGFILTSQPDDILNATGINI